MSDILDTYAYCLLGNHFHLLVRVKEMTGFDINEGLTDFKNSEDLTGFKNLSGLKTYFKPSTATFTFPFTFTKAIIALLVNCIF